MGKYNFDEIIDRHGTSCNKWEYNIPEDVVPMWVADMDFAAAPEIREAMQKRLDHPVYGYTHHSKELKDAIVSWVGRRYHWDIQSEWLGFSPGVVPALVMSLLSLTTPGDRIVIMTPVYHPFYSSIEENGRVIINHQLDCDENGRYSINFERLEAQIDNRCKAIMMCNPHNPAGRVWTKEELLEVAKIKSGSAEPNRKKVASITWDQVRAIATDKMKDLNAFEIEKAMSMVAGTARSRGITVTGDRPF